MAEYLAPGVYVEETSFRAKSIEGVGTSTAAFVGPALRGPVVTNPDLAEQAPELLTSFGDFERIYGGFGELEIGATRRVNHTALAVAAFFNNGGSRLYFARVSAPNQAASTGGAPPLVFHSRFVGRQAGGVVVVRLVRQPIGAAGLARAPAGTVIEHTDGGTSTHVRQPDGTWSPAIPGGATPANTNVVTATVTAEGFGAPVTVDDLGLDTRHPRYIGTVLAASPANRADWLTQPVRVEITDGTTADALITAMAPDAGSTVKRVTLGSGSDGDEPVAANYTLALRALMRRDDISIVAAPGSTALGDGAAIQAALVQHVATGRGGQPTYRIAVLDAPAAQTPSEVRDFKAAFDDTRAALYYPWIVTPNPLAATGDATQPREIATPPSGFVAGVYARTDVLRGVHKAPANEVVFGANRFAYPVNEAEQAMLNPLGVNCLRTLPNRGNRVWGARTTSSDPEWKYVPVRRYFLYLEASIERGTQWAVFEPNGERLWANIRETIDAFLFNEWKNGALLGASPKEAYFVKCDRSTMSQNDLDNGRLICLVGVAPLRPAEFVIFRIGQKTADARD